MPSRRASLRFRLVIGVNNPIRSDGPASFSLFWTRVVPTPFIDHALGFADGALDGADFDVGADADGGLDVVLERRAGAGVAFDDDGEVVERTVLGELEHVVR